MAAHTLELVTVAAVSENGVIGADGDIPWESIPADRDQYRERIAGHPVILGRRTFEMYDDLPGSAQIVLSRSDREFAAETAHHASGVDDAIAIAESLGAEKAYVLGGAGIYELFQPVVDRLALSRVPGQYEGDAFFPDWDPAAWTRVDIVEYDRFTLEEWVRDST